MGHSKQAQRILRQIEGGRYITFSHKARATIAACIELRAEGLVDVHAHGSEYLVCETGARVKTLAGLVGG